MQNDLISRSVLIAQLEGFKLSLGDVILGFVVDRVIERVRALPAVEVASKIEYVDKSCDYCRHRHCLINEDPCKSCLAMAEINALWEPADENL